MAASAKSSLQPFEFQGIGITKFCGRPKAECIFQIPLGSCSSTSELAFPDFIRLTLVANCQASATCAAIANVATAALANPPLFLRSNLFLDLNSVSLVVRFTEYRSFRLSFLF